MSSVFHLSDLHVRDDDNAMENQNARAIVQHLLNEHKTGRLTSSDLVCVTGDLTDDGGPEQYRAIDDLLSLLAPLVPIIATPGNHDYAEEGNVFKPGSVGLFQEFLLGGRMLPMFRMYPTAFGNNICWMGLDSADPKDEEWFAEGVIDEQQLEWLSRMLRQIHKDDFRLLTLHHHPFQRDVGMQLHNAEALMNAIQGQVDLVLFGHKHVSEIIFWASGKPTMIASGKVTEPVRGSLQFRQIKIEDRAVQSIKTVEIQAVCLE